MEKAPRVAVGWAYEPFGHGNDRCTCQSNQIVTYLCYKKSFAKLKICKISHCFCLTAEFLLLVTVCKKNKKKKIKTNFFFFDLEIFKKDDRIISLACDTIWYLHDKRIEKIDTEFSDYRKRLMEEMGIKWAHLLFYFWNSRRNFFFFFNKTQISLFINRLKSIFPEIFFFIGVKSVHFDFHFNYS